MTTKVEEAAALTQLIPELKRRLKLLERGMSLKEFIAVEGTRVIPSNPFPKLSSAGIDTPVA